MIAHARWDFDIAWAAVAEIARLDLEDWLEDYAELQRLEAEVEDPPIHRIPDMTVWYVPRMQAIRDIKGRWGAR